MVVEDVLATADLDVVHEQQLPRQDAAQVGGATELQGTQGSKMRQRTRMEEVQEHAFDAAQVGRGAELHDGILMYPSCMARFRLNSCKLTRYMYFVYLTRMYMLG